MKMKESRKSAAGCLIALIVLLFSQVVHAQQALPNQAQVVALARQLEVAINKGDVASAEDTLDVEALLDREMAGVSAPASFAAGFRVGARRNLSLMAGIIQNAKGGTYRFLRVRQINGQTRALFRILGAGGGVNYHDWIVGTDAAGRMRFQDAFIALTGEEISQSLRRLYIVGAVQGNPTLLDKLTGVDKQYAANISTVLQIIRDAQGGNYSAALTSYQSLPQGLRENKTMMVLRLGAVSNLQKQRPQEYNAAVSDFRRLFPHDACLDLVCLDQLIETGAYPEARESIDRIEAFTGQDAYLDAMRANMYRLQGGSANLSAAQKEYEKAIALEPTLHEPYWGLVYLSLQNKDFDRTVELLNRIQRELHVRIADLE
ncbi:MAG TPA: hypothetical protein VN670_08850, partial [Acidobacteriaceae bacterium]|nr:hypothetical protein [Acidobacteriaceae bacterium]